MSKLTLVHPGEILLESIKSNGLNITETAKLLKVSRAALSSVVNGRSALSTLMCVRLSIILDISLGFWLNLKREYEISKTEYEIVKESKKAFKLKLQRHKV